MSLKIDQSPAAIADVLNIADYLAEQSDLNTSDRFLNATTRTFRQLADMPGMGVQRTYNNPGLVGMRMFPVAGFPKHLVLYQVVLYQATEAELRILRVIHGSQNLAQIFSPTDLD